ncbi:MAG: hypothetical protein KDA44_05965 [Planctomycetales bacterium]|nr:hypothetical protein [Planctomycetales bacterium]
MEPTLENAPPDLPQDNARLLQIGLLALLMLACAYPLSINIVDPDLWGHVKYGQDWIADGHLHRTATHAYTAEGYPWVNHENLAELTFAWGFDHLGVYPMLVLKCLWGLAILATMAWLARRQGVHPITAWVLLLVVAYNLQAFFPMRPQLLSFGWFTAIMVCCHLAFERMADEGRVHLKWLLAVPVLMACWVNSHGGFALGLAVTGVLLCGRMIELFARRGWASWRDQLGIAMVGLACLASTLVNPYGPGLLEWMANSLGNPRPEITEWAPLRPEHPMFVTFVTLNLIAVASLWRTTVRRDWTQIAILAITCWQAWAHLRHIAFFSLMCGLWLPVHFQSALASLRSKKTGDATGETPVETGGAAAHAPHAAPAWMKWAAAAGIACGVTAQSWALSEQFTDFPVWRSHFPVDAIQYMVDHRMRGKLVVNFNWAQYAIAALSPEVKVGFDGRFRTCYPQSVIDMHFDFLLGGHKGLRYRAPDSGPIDGQKVLSYMDPDMVLIDSRYGDCVAVMHEQAEADDPAWTLLYSNQMCELYGRTERYADPASPDFIAVDERQIGQKLFEARFQWPALPDRSLAEELDAQDALSAPSPRLPVSSPLQTVN